MPCLIKSRATSQSRKKAAMPVYKGGSRAFADEKEQRRMERYGQLNKYPREKLKGIASRYYKVYDSRGASKSDLIADILEAEFGRTKGD